MNLDPGEPLHRRSRLAKATSFAVARFISRGRVRDHLGLHGGVHRQHLAQIGAVLASGGEYRQSRILLCGGHSSSGGCGHV